MNKKKILLLFALCLFLVCGVFYSCSAPSPESTSVVKPTTVVIKPTKVEELLNRRDLTYAEKMNEYFVIFVDSFAATSDLWYMAGDDSSIIFEDWWIDAIIFEFAVQSVTCEEIREVIPGEVTQRIHNHLLLMCNDIDMAIDLQIKGIDNVDANSLQRGVDYMDKVIEHIDDAGIELQQLNNQIGF